MNEKRSSYLTTFMPWEAIGALILVVVILGVTTAVNYVNTDRVRFHSDTVRHTYDVLQLLNHIDTEVQRAESGQRGFLITGNEIYLAAYVGVGNRVRLQVEVLTKAVADNS